jgi:hypothetical protein
MLSNRELLEMAKYYKIRVNSLSLKNELPAKIELGFSIYNLDSADKLGNATGTHWTGSFCDAKRCCYFDSFGAPCPNEIDRFIKKRFSTYGINNWIIQDPKSENCGFFVLAYSIFMTHLYKGDIYRGANEFVNLFVEDTKENDRILKSFFTRFGNIHPIVKSKLLK